MTIVMCGFSNDSIVFVADGKRTGIKGKEVTDAIKIYEIASDIPVMITISGKAEMNGDSWLKMMPDFRSDLKSKFPDGPKLQDVIDKFVEFAAIKTKQHGATAGKFADPDRNTSLKDGNTFIVAGYDEPSESFKMWRLDRRPLATEFGSPFIVNCCCWIGNDSHLNAINYGSKYQTGMSQSDTVKYCREGVDDTISNNPPNSDVGGIIRTATITKTSFQWVGDSVPPTSNW